MVARTRTRSERRPRRTRRAHASRVSYRRMRLALVDRVMLAGSVGGAVYLFLLHLAGAGTGAASMAGVFVAGLAFGVLVVARRLPVLRSPFRSPFVRTGRGRR